MSIDPFAVAPTPNAATSAFMPAGTASEEIKRLEALARRLQDEAAEANATTRALEEENALLKGLPASAPESVSSVSASQANNKKFSGLPPALIDQQNAVRNFCGSFAFSVDAWSDGNAVTRNTTPTSISAFTVAARGVRPRWLRNDNKTIDHDTYKDDVAVAFRDHLPEGLASVVVPHQAKFILVTTHYLQSARYGLATKCRTSRAEIFSYLGLPKACYAKDPACRRVPEVAVVLGRNPTTNRLPATPKIIYGSVYNPVSQKSENLPFGSQGILNVLQVMMYSHHTLSQAPSAWTTSGNNAYNWKLKSVTPAMIAFATIMVIHLLSGDKELAAEGDYTHYPYEHRYRVFTGVLIMTWNEPGVRVVVNHINEVLFRRLPLFERTEEVEIIEEDEEDDLVANLQGISVAEDADTAISREEADPLVTMTVSSSTPAQTPGDVATERVETSDDGSLSDLLRSGETATANTVDDVQLTQRAGSSAAAAIVGGVGTEKGRGTRGKGPGGRGSRGGRGRSTTSATSEAQPRRSTRKATA